MKNTKTYFFIKIYPFICQSINPTLQQQIKKMIEIENGLILDISNISNIFKKKIISKKKQKSKSKKNQPIIKNKIILPTSKLEINDPIYLANALTLKIKTLQGIYLSLIHI